MRLARHHLALKGHKFLAVDDMVKLAEAGDDVAQTERAIGASTSEAVVGRGLIGLFEDEPAFVHDGGEGTAEIIQRGASSFWERQV